MSETAEKPKKSWVEPAVAILMAVTTLATTWCSFQSSKWSGQSDSLASRASSLDRKANLLSLEGLQWQAAQSGIFFQLMNARLAGNDRVVKFYEERMGGEFKPAYEAWLAQKPFENPKADPHPFVTNLYTARFSRDVIEARTEAANSIRESDRSGTITGRYLSNAEMLAAVLFFVGTSTGFDSRRVRLFSFVFGATLFLYVASRMIMLPVAT